jgi:hypothetical protein
MRKSHARGLRGGSAMTARLANARAIVSWAMSSAPPRRFDGAVERIM